MKQYQKNNYISENKRQRTTVMANQKSPKNPLKNVKDDHIHDRTFLETYQEPPPVVKENFKDYLKHTSQDLLAGMVVFLVALPLCLGIALASGAPPFGGLIAGVIGGVVIGFLSGSQLSVSGPAAGLAVIVLHAIHDIGSYDQFLVAVVLAGVLQLALGYIKAGIIGLYFPSSVIKGMLAAIGLMLILKQIPHFFGVDKEAFGWDAFFEPDNENTFSAILHAFSKIHEGSFTIAAVSLTILILWEQPFLKKFTFFKRVPAALFAVIVGVLLNIWFRTWGGEWLIAPEHLVKMPDFSQGFVSAFTTPNWAGLGNPLIYKTAFTLAIIASLETLLSLEAIDKLDPHKRHSPQNRELKAQGMGNILSGLIGGLPITSVIVRSSANVNAGGETKMSAIYHGLIMAICILLIPNLLGLIPLSCLSAVLFMVGFKLTKPALIKGMYQLGWLQFLPFITTIIAILFTDLLVGICIGLAVGVFFILQANYKRPYFYDSKSFDNGDHHIYLHLSGHISFLNKAAIQLTIDNFPEGSFVTIDGTGTEVFDYDALELIHNFAETAHERNIKVELKGIPDIQKAVAAH